MLAMLVDATSSRPKTMSSSYTLRHVWADKSKRSLAQISTCKSKEYDQVIKSFGTVCAKLVETSSYELPPKLYCPKMEYLFFLRFKGSPSFYKGFDQTFTNIRTVSRSHHFELLAAAMAKVVKNNARMCQDVPGVVLWLVEATRVLEEATVAAQAAGAGAVAVAVE